MSTVKHDFAGFKIGTMLKEPCEKVAEGLLGHSYRKVILFVEV
jgi:hypothetical protein